MAAVLAFSVAMTLLLFVSPVYMMQVYDRVLQSRNVGTLVSLTSIAFGLHLAYSLIEHSRSRLLARLGVRLDFYLSRLILERTFAIGGASHAPSTQQLLSDSGKLRDFLSGGMTTLCDLPWAPLFLLVCFLFHPMLGLLVTTGAGILVALAVWGERRISARVEAQSSRSGAVQAELQHMLRSQGPVSALGMGGALKNRWFGGQEQMLDKHLAIGDSGSAFVTVSRFVRQALQTAMLGTGAYLALSNAISPGMIIAVSIIGGKALAPIDGLVAQWKQLATAHSAAVRLKSFFSSPFPALPSTVLPRPTGAVVFSRLVLCVPGTRAAILQNVDCQVQAGEIVAVVGTSGSGKSTLLQAAVGAWKAASGSVRLDGSLVEQWHPDSLGKHVGYVPQRVEMLPGSIALNICRFGSADGTSAIDAAKLVEADTVIRTLPRGFDTEVGPGAAPIPGDVFQRIGIARALFGEPALVVMDEPTTGLDPDGRAALIVALRQLKTRGATVLIATQERGIHALSDKILALGDGTIRLFKPTSEFLERRRQGGEARDRDAKAEGATPSGAPSAAVG